MKLNQLQTPALLLDKAVLQRNLESMAGRTAGLGVSLRPHVKTHKCLEVAALQAACGAMGFTVSTLAEARVLADAGFHDLTWALPLPWPSIPEALDFCREIRLRLLLDSEATLKRVERAAAAAGVRPHVWLKVDCGYHRAGVDPESPLAFSLARLLAASPSLEFDGLLTHAGHAYQARNAEQRLRIAHQERSAVVGLADRLRNQGLPVPSVSLGSTPTLTIVEDLGGVDEARPGNYAYFDLTQLALGSCRLEEIAVSVLATVVSCSDTPARAVIDAGALALSRDPGCTVGSEDCMGGVCASLCEPLLATELRLASLSQEHGVIVPVSAARRPPGLEPGVQVRILPNHSCLVSACFDHLYVVEAGEVVDRWKIHRQRWP